MELSHNTIWLAEIFKKSTSALANIFITSQNTNMI